MMHFLALQHLDIEPPALIADVLLAAGHTLATVHLDQGDELPGSTGHIDGAIIMGGPQSANDMQTNYIREELIWLEQAIDDGLPMLGICLGAQMMAKAAGAGIFTSPVRELGWCPVHRTTSSETDPLFTLMQDGLMVFQWHGETFSMTDTMTLTATHPDVPAQAFRLGRGQYGLQFHVEVKECIIEDWIRAGDSERHRLGSSGIDKLRSQTPEHLQTMQKFCRQMTQAWLKEIQSL
jgi:GMP synthase-like glutamine amidotransferase